MPGSEKWHRAYKASMVQITGFQLTLINGTGFRCGTGTAGSNAIFY